MPPKKSRRRSVPDVSVFAEACGRTRILNRAATFFASSIFQDIGIIAENDTSSINDVWNYQRTRKRNRMNNVTLNKTVFHLQSLYFNGKK